MQSYYGGRAECRIRHTAIPVVHTDFLSEYPTVNTLLGLWTFFAAEAFLLEHAEVQGVLQACLSSILQQFDKVRPSVCHDQVDFAVAIQVPGDDVRRIDLVELTFE